MTECCQFFRICQWGLDWLNEGIQFAVEKYRIIPLIFWIGLSLFVMVFSYRLDLGELHNPGPGLMPFLSSLLLFIICLYLLLRSALRIGSRDLALEDQNQVNFRKVWPILGVLFAYALFLEKVGYLISTFILMAILFKSAGFKRWTSVLISSALVNLVTYFVFTFLGIRFPEWIF